MDEDFLLNIRDPIDLAEAGPLLCGASRSIIRDESGASRRASGWPSWTQDMLNFCALNKIEPQIQKVSMTEVDGARRNVVDRKVRYRYVIDMKA